MYSVLISYSVSDGAPMFFDDVFFDMHTEDKKGADDSNAYNKRSGKSTVTHSCNSISAVPSELKFITRYVYITLLSIKFYLCKLILP